MLKNALRECNYVKALRVLGLLTFTYLSSVHVLLELIFLVLETHIAANESGNAATGLAKSFSKWFFK